MKPENGLRRVSLFSLAVLAACAACGASSDAALAPKPALSDSPAAQAELRGILQRFASGSRGERIALKPALIAFHQRHPGDGLARLADVHLAWIALENGSLRYAEAAAANIEQKGSGTPFDIARVVRGAALRRAGKPKTAITVLRPLVGKVIDPYVRALLNEEVVAAAMAAGAFPAALDLIAVWLREADQEERAVVKAHVRGLLPEIPIEELARALRARQEGAAGDPSDPDLDLRTLVTEHLGTIALERRDARLADVLVNTSGSLLGAQADAVAHLASGTWVARVEAPTVGLLLSVRTPEARRRGLDIAAGVAHGLGLPSAGAGRGRASSGAHLVSRDDGAVDGGGTGVEEALSSLTAEGAAVLIAGADLEQANAAAAFARAQAVPVLLLHPPDERALDSAFVFVVGERPAGVTALLTGALVERGASPVALVDVGPPEPAGAPVHGTAALRLSCAALPDARALRSAGIQGLALNGDAACAERAVGLLPPGARAAFGFDAAAAARPGALAATAGAFPFEVARAPAAPSSAGAEKGSPERGSIEAWIATHPSPPSFWAALARDAGVLAWAGVRDLPALGTDQPSEVRSRRLAAASALARAEVNLWTSSARGFGGARVLPRTIGIREIKTSR